MTDSADPGHPKPGPLQEIIRPLVDVVRAPRALWGVNIGYFLEGFVYFGILTYLAMYFNEYVGLDDIRAGWMVGVQTFGITLAMFFFGGFADRWGARRALVVSFVLLTLGRIVMSLAPSLIGRGTGMGSMIHLVSMGGILIVLLGYGLYQPAAYAAVRQYTTEKTASMGYAMLYALMNLGAFLPFFLPDVRQSIAISGMLWLFTALTLVSLILTVTILTPRTERRTVALAAVSRPGDPVDDQGMVIGPLVCSGCGSHLARKGLLVTHGCPDCGAPVSRSLPSSLRKEAAAEKTSKSKEPFRFLRWLAEHPLADVKFSFFIFSLIPVQTLFAHNWLTIPQYVKRAYRDSWIGDRFEMASNFNPLLIFLLVPMVTALTAKSNIYRMMIVGTFIMAAPTFLLALGPTFWTLLGFIVLMSIGEAMWQPRFLQYAAEIAPEGRTGAYMGVAQFPWFLTKLIVPMYSGWFLKTYCPEDGPLQTERMWLIYGLVAMSSTVMLWLARNWLGKDFKTKAS